MFKNVAVNKTFAINQLMAAIARAKDLLAVAGESPQYYAWHHKTVANCKVEIEAIKAAPLTNWN